MTAKEYLSQYGKLVLETKVLEEDIRELRERATSISSSTDSEHSSSGNKDKIGNAVSRLADLQEKCKNKAKKAYKKRIEIEDAIEGLQLGSNESTYKAILKLRYISRLTWEQIAEVMNYSERWVQKLHGRALQEFEKTIEKSS